MEVIVANLLVWLIAGLLLGGTAVVLQLANMKSLMDGDGIASLKVAGAFICGLLASVSFLLFLIAALARIVNG